MAAKACTGQLQHLSQSWFISIAFLIAFRARVEQKLHRSHSCSENKGYDQAQEMTYRAPGF